jgi:hypothetical protein
MAAAYKTTGGKYEYRNKTAFSRNIITSL